VLFIKPNECPCEQQHMALHLAASRPPFQLTHIQRAALRSRMAASVVHLRVKHASCVACWHGLSICRRAVRVLPQILERCCGTAGCTKYKEWQTAANTTTLCLYPGNLCRCAEPYCAQQAGLCHLNISTRPHRRADVGAGCASMARATCSGATRQLAYPLAFIRSCDARSRMEHITRGRLESHSRWGIICSPADVCFRFAYPAASRRWCPSP